MDHCDPFLYLSLLGCRPNDYKGMPARIDDNGYLESKSRSRKSGKMSRRGGAVESCKRRKDFTAAPTRWRWSGYDASEARSVYRESLWNTKGERASTGHLAKVSVTARHPPSPASCAGHAFPGVGGGRISRWPLDMPRCTNVWQSASSSCQPLWRPEVCTTNDPVWCRQGSHADPNTWTPCVGLRDGIPNQENEELATVPTLMALWRRWHWAG